MAEERFAEAVETLSDADTEERALALVADGRVCASYSDSDPERPGYSELLALCRVVERNESVHTAFVERIRGLVVESARDPQREYESRVRLTSQSPRPVWQETLRLKLDLSLPRTQLDLIDAVRELSPDVDRDELASVLGELSEFVRTHAQTDRPGLSQLSDRQLQIATQINVGNFTAAEAGLREIIETGPVDAWSCGTLADLLSRQGRVDEALELRLRHVQLDPGNAQVHALLGRTYRFLKRFDEAESAMQQALRLDSDLASLHWELAWNRRDQDRTSDSIPHFKKAIELDSREPVYVEDLARALHDEERYAEAEPVFLHAIALRPGNVWTHWLMGWNYRKQGRNADGVPYFQQAAELDSDEPRFQEHLAMALHDEGRHDEAEPVFKRALSLHPDNEWTHHLLGKGYRLQKRFDESAREQSRALELSPGYAWARHEMGRTLREQGRVLEAIPYLQRATELEPGEASFWEQLASALYADGRYAEAEPAFLQVTELRPQMSWGFYWRGLTLNRLGRYAEAVEALSRALQSQLAGLHRHNVLQALGRAQRLAGRPDDAIASLTESRAEAEADHGADDNSGMATLGELMSARVAAGQGDLARQDAERLIGLRSKVAEREGSNARENNEIAWLLLTCDVVDLRDPQLALQYAMKANELGQRQDPAHLDTLALGYYRTGRSDEAVRVQSEALALLAVDASDRAEFEKRLEEYVAGSDGDGEGE